MERDIKKFEELSERIYNAEDENEYEIISPDSLNDGLEAAKEVLSTPEGIEYFKKYFISIKADLFPLQYSNSTIEGLNIDLLNKTRGQVESIINEMISQLDSGEEIDRFEDLQYLEKFFKKLLRYSPDFINKIVKDVPSLEAILQNSHEYHEKSLDRISEIAQAREKKRKESYELNKEKYIEEGMKVIHPSKLEKWKNYVEEAGYYQIGPEKMTSAIRIMEMLDRGESFDSIFENDELGFKHKEADLSMIYGVMLFAKNGPEFYEYYAEQIETDLTEKELQELKEVKKENAQLREVTISEVGEVAKGVTLETAKNALGVVTNSNEEPVINNDGQSHNDE